MNAWMTGQKNDFFVGKRAIKLQIHNISKGEAGLKQVYSQMKVYMAMKPDAHSDKQLILSVL